MVITILEAQVIEQKWPALQEAYNKGAGQVPPGLVQSFLIQDTTNPIHWRIMTIWQNREALDAMRRVEAVPQGVRVFRAAGANPALTIWDIAGQVAAPVEVTTPKE